MNSIDTSVVIGVVGSVVSQLVKSEKWSRWITVGAVAGFVGTVGYLTGDDGAIGKIDSALIAVSAAFATHGVIFTTPIGAKLKAGLWDHAVSAMANIFKSVTGNSAEIAKVGVQMTADVTTTTTVATAEAVKKVSAAIADTVKSTTKED